MEKIINKYFSYFIYFFVLVITLFLLYQARSFHLLPIPQEGTDQLSMLKAAVRMYHGEMPNKGYQFSPVYTFFLYILVILSGGNLLIIRILQAVVAALIPVFIYKISRRLRLGFQASQIAAILYCFYGTAILISLDLLRASMLALCFTLFTFCLVKGYMKKRLRYYIFGGIFAGLIVLGRENFIPIIFLPFSVLFFRKYRKHIHKKQIIFYGISFLCVLLPLMTYNLIMFNSFSTIPGNFETVFRFFHGQGVDKAVETSNLPKYLLNIPIQCLNFMSSYEIPNSLSVYAHKEIIDYMKIFFIPFNFFIIMGILGIIYCRKNAGVLFITLLCLCYIGTLLIFHILYRFRIPVLPLIIVLNASGIKYLLHLGKKKGLTVLAFILILTFITYVDPNKYRTDNERLSVATVMIKNNMLFKAENYLVNLAEDSILPDHLWKLLIQSYLKSGDKVSASRVYKQYLFLKKQNKQVVNE